MIAVAEERCSSTVSGRRVRALWAGGPERHHEMAQGIRSRLAAVGVDVADTWADDQSRTAVKHSFPSLVGIDVVIINVDWIGHGLHDAAKAAAKARGVRWVYASLSATKTIVEMQNKGILKMNLAIPAEEPVPTPKPALVPPALVEAKPTPAAKPRTTKRKGSELRELDDGLCEVDIANGSRGRPWRPVVVDGVCLAGSRVAADLLSISYGSIGAVVAGERTVPGHVVRYATYDEALTVLDDLIKQGVERRAADTARRHAPAKPAPVVTSKAPSPAPTVTPTVTAPKPLPSTKARALFRLHRFPGLVVLEPLEALARSFASETEIPADLRPFVEGL